MQTDLTTRLLLTGILLCLGLLVVQAYVGATGHHGAGATPGRYLALTLRSGMKWTLVRADTVTGDLWRADDVLTSEAHWFVYPDPLAESAETDVEEAVSEKPAPPQGFSAAVEGVPASGDDKDVSTLARVLSARTTPEMRIWAAEQLGESPGDNADVVPLLIKLLPRADPKLLVATLQALGRRADGSTLSAVREFLDHPDSQVQSAARAAVSQISGETPSEAVQGAR